MILRLTSSSRGRHRHCVDGGNRFQKRHHLRTWHFVATFGVVLMLVLGVSAASGAYGPQVVLFTNTPADGMGQMAVDQWGHVFAAEAADVVELFPGSNVPRSSITHPFAAVPAGPSGLTLDGPSGVAVDPAGDLFVTDEFNDRVLEEQRTGENTWGAQTVLPFAPSYALASPEAVAVDAAGDVFVADTNDDRVLELPKLAGGYGTGFGAPTVVESGLTIPEGLGVDAAGDLFIANTYADQVLELPCCFGASTALPLSGLDLPSQIAFTGSGDLLVAGGDDSHVVQLSRAGASWGSQSDLGFDGMNETNGVAVDCAGDVFATDVHHGRILELPAVPPVVPAPNCPHHAERLKGRPFNAVEGKSFSVTAATFAMPAVDTQTTLAASSPAGATSINVVSTAGMAIGCTMTIGTGAHAETVTITSVGPAGPGGPGVTFAPPLAFTHQGGDKKAGELVTITCLFTAAQFTGTIDWGDGTTSPTDGNPVVIAGPPGGPFTVSGGPHVYGEEGTYTVTVTVAQIGNANNTATVSYVVHVQPVPLTIQCNPKPAPVSWMDVSGQQVATFTHVNPHEPLGLGEFTATIDWGAGAVPATTSGTVGGNPFVIGPSYKVTGSVNYSTAGPKTVTLTVTDSDGPDDDDPSETVTKVCKADLTIKGKRSKGFTVASRNHDIWLAGMPNLTTDNFAGDVAPAQSPFLAPVNLAVPPGQYLVFHGVTGTPGFDSGGSVPHTSSCDGSTIFPNFVHGSANGMAALSAPANSLIGVFVGPLPPAPPAYAGVPPGLDFSTATGSIPSGIPVGGGPLLAGAASRTFATLSPALKQPFFIGDGLDGGGNPQQFFIPAGATRLYLGTMDGQMWSDNIGQCSVGTVLTSDP